MLTPLTHIHVGEGAKTPRPLSIHTKKPDFTLCSQVSVSLNICFTTCGLNTRIALNIIKIQINIDTLCDLSVIAPLR